MAAEWFEIDYECATEPGETSLAGTHPLNVYADFDDRDFFVTDERGWLPALEAMGWDSAKIMLNKTILKVESTSQHVRVDYADSTTGGVGSITAAYAISTFSLGVLQHSHAEIFSPALPIWKQFELAKFEMAAYLKIFIQFETHFWGEDEYILYASPTRGYYPSWQNLDAPGFSNGTNTILATLTGNWARRAELMTDEAILAEAVAVLGEIFGAENVTTATGIFVGRWVTDPLTRGMFSNWPTGVSDVDFIRLSTAVDRVLFAGEATHPKYNGYVHGALLSGINSAASAAACLGNTSSDKCNCAYNRLCDTYTGTTHPAHDQQDQHDPAQCPTAEGVNTQDAAAATCLAASVAALTIAVWWMDP
jgi:polyamine oxidase